MTLVGQSLPYFDECLKMMDDIGNIFPDFKYYSTDIAITPQGPCLIEVNIGGNISLAQYASGKGFLTDEFRSFLKENKYSL